LQEGEERRDEDTRREGRLSGKKDCAQSIKRQSTCRLRLESTLENRGYSVKAGEMMEIAEGEERGGRLSGKDCAQSIKRRSTCRPRLESTLKNRWRRLQPGR
jgi:hypothetical protein